jgi:hypothetical protein
MSADQPNPIDPTKQRLAETIAAEGAVQIVDGLSLKVATLTGFETESWHVGISAKTDKKRAFTDI